MSAVGADRAGVRHQPVDAFTTEAFSVGERPFMMRQSPLAAHCSFLATHVSAMIVPAHCPILGGTDDGVADKPRPTRSDPLGS